MVWKMCRPPAVPAAVAQLQRLDLNMPHSDSMASETVQALEAKVVPHLTSLTSLWVFASSCLACKQSLWSTRHSSCFVVSLRQLEFDYAGLLSPTTLPGIQCLTALEDLGVSSCGVEPSFLLLMATSLTRLSLEYATLQPSDSTLGASQLLQVLARLPALRLLELRNISGQWPQQLPAYSALTASSNLQELVACGCDIPGAAWAHAFPAGRQLAHLWRFEGRPHDEPYKCPGPGPFDSAGITRLASCCPALDTLGITSEDASLAPLHPLTALTSLRVGPLSPAVISSHLAALSQLQELYVSVADRDDDTPAWHQHLVPLTALRNLTHICCLLDVDSEEDEKEFQEAQDFAVYTWQGAPAGSPPDVWLQLLGHCARCLAMVWQQVAELAAELKEQQRQMHS